jgi:hypothetical protein
LVTIMVKGKLFVDCACSTNERSDMGFSDRPCGDSTAIAVGTTSDGTAVILANILQLMIEGNRGKRPVQSGETNFTKFQSSYVPELSTLAYLARIQMYSKATDAVLTLTLIYIDRLIESSGLIITCLNIHRILIATIMIATKFHEDVYYNNTFYAKLGGLPLKELNALEVRCLR